MVRGESTRLKHSGFSGTAVTDHSGEDLLVGAPHSIQARRSGLGLNQAYFASIPTVPAAAPLLFRPRQPPLLGGCYNPPPPSCPMLHPVSRSLSLSLLLLVQGAEKWGEAEV
uniref:Uncharacterized protein n=1 Tax=Opuntia streptacantha TaxID=393608 RepID=A0A7C9ERY1_OPUST